MKMLKKKHYVATFGLLLGVSFLLFMAHIYQLQGVANNTHKIGARNNLEREGKKLMDMGQYQEALEKFTKANSKKFDLYEHPYGGSSRLMRGVYFLQGQYEEALNDLNQLVGYFPKHQVYQDEKLEYETLIKARDTHSNQPIYEHIDHLKKVYAWQLPPTNYTFGSATPISTMLRLYDTIGDYNAGIQFVDEILDFLKFRRKNKNEPYDVYDRIKSVAEAEVCIKKGVKNNPDWHGCKFLKEYLLIREAFLQDKAEGLKGCLNAKPHQTEGGQVEEVCMGRATKALIQSDYFPW